MKTAHRIHKTPGQVEAWRIVLALPGREKTLHQYTRAVDVELAQRKAAELASIVMRSWSWSSDSDLLAIQDQDSDDMVLVLGDSVEKGAAQCSL